MSRLIDLGITSEEIVARATAIVERRARQYREMFARGAMTIARLPRTRADAGMP